MLFKSAMTLDGKVATRTGDSHWISGARAARCVHRWRAECDAVAVGIGTALADDPLLTAAHRRTPPASRAASSSTPRRACRSTRSSSSALDEVPLIVIVVAAPPRAERPTRSRRRRRGDRGHRAENEPRARRAALDELGRREHPASILLEGGPHLAGAFLDAGEVDEMRLFVAPVVLGGPGARDPLEGEGVERDRRRRPRALALECERIGDDVLISRAAAGVVSACSPGSSQDLGTVDGRRRHRRRRAPARRARALAGELARGRLGRGQRRLPDRHRDRRRRASSADVMHETLRADLARRARAAGAGQPRAAAARRRTASAATSCRATSTASATVARGRATTASPAASASTRPDELLRYVVEKGSIAVDGVSLTVAGARPTTASRSR